MSAFPRITFGIIVLNGEPFTRYNLRALYPFAHEIIVVEGAVPAAANIATSDGHSRDGTLEVLRQFKAEEDPENKIQLITKEGFWSEKDEMSQAYAQRATGDYLWQVDVDEFYKPEDMQSIIMMLRDDPEITTVSFPMLTFWGAPDYLVDGWYLRRGANVYHRLFKWGGENRYQTHRPPTVVNEHGVDLRKLNWIGAEALRHKGIFLYHYSLLFPTQVINKSDYYGVAYPNHSGGRYWAKENYVKLTNPFRVHNVYKSPSWLERHTGAIPPQISAMWHDIQSGKMDIQLRPNDDVERLLGSRWYQLQRFAVKKLDQPAQIKQAILRRLRRLTQG